MDKPNIEKTLNKESTARFFKWFAVALLVTTAVVMLGAYFLSPNVKYFFSNKGKLICVERSDWVFKSGETDCYRVSKIE